MNALLVALNALSVVLEILKAIPATSAIANEIAEVDTAVQNAIAAGASAATASGEVVNPALLLPITPLTQA